MNPRRGFDLFSLAPQRRRCNHDLVNRPIKHAPEGRRNAIARTPDAQWAFCRAVRLICRELRVFLFAPLITRIEDASAGAHADQKTH